MKSKMSRSSPRPPLTTEELERLTANDVVRVKLTEDEKSRLREINRKRARERVERAGRLRMEEEPILAELRSIGWSVNSVWDFVNTSDRYDAVVPILLKHLMLPYSDRTREGIARALAVPYAQHAWSMLVAEYRKAPVGSGSVAPGETQELPLHAKDGLAVALSATVTNNTIDELIALAMNPSLGDSRVLLLRGIRKSKNPAAKKAIEELATDPALAKEIASWKRAR